MFIHLKGGWKYANKRGVPHQELAVSQTVNPHEKWLQKVGRG